MRLLLFTTALASVLLLPKPGQAALPCEFYGGHIDLEGKIGNQRDIGETSIFLPLACNETSLLYTDLRFKKDNFQNMEGNFGLGFRQLYTTGIWGNYFYFDRKVSGITDKYHSQLTLGTEWLAEKWEVRANAYVPTTGEKSVSTGGAIGGVNFSGNNILIQQVAGSRLTEEPLYGVDAEAGFKIPDTKFWLHAGGFSFHGNDVDDVTGGRIRARYDLTKNISLSAEGQYDDVRGRQGWLGVRFTLPFGGPTQKPEGLRARMTASPVRDVDIVTQSKTKAIGENSSITVLNSNTGSAQRVLYVDNTAAGGGDGSKENPFNDIINAQAQLQDNDVVYVYSGDGSSTGMNKGFNINRNNVQLIGSGTDFVYDGNKFTINSILNPSGTVLIGKTIAPTLTNTNAWQKVINVYGSDTTIAGLNVESGLFTAVEAIASGVNMGNLFLRDVSISNNDGTGLNIALNNGGEFGDITLENVTTNGNSGYGTLFDIQSGSKVGNITVNGLTSSNNLGHNGRGLFFRVWDSEVGNISLNDLTIEGNASATAAITVGVGGSTAKISSLEINRANIASNAGTGVFVDAGNMGSILSVKLDNVRSVSNGLHGFFFETYQGGSMSVSMQNSTATLNQQHGVRLQKDSSDLTTADFGGAGLSAGGNSFYGNGVSNPAAFYDLNHGFGAYVVSVQNSWWGAGGRPDCWTTEQSCRF